MRVFQLKVNRTFLAANYLLKLNTPAFILSFMMKQVRALLLLLGFGEKTLNLDFFLQSHPQLLQQKPKEGRKDRSRSKPKQTKNSRGLPT